MIESSPIVWADPRPRTPWSARAPDEAVWHAAWPFGMAAAAALLLLAVGGVSVQVLLALTVMALPGIIGALWRPKAEARFALLAVWAVGAGLAVCASGGLAGPLAALCAAPAIVGFVLGGQGIGGEEVGGDWRAGAGLSAATALICLLAGVLRWPPPPPLDPARTWLSLVAVLTVAAAAGGALWVVRRRAEAERDGVAAELSAFQALMGDLPELAVVMDAQGRTQAVFGQPLAGLEIEALHAGLVHAAWSADRPKLEATMQEALSAGAARTTFASSMGEGRIAVALQRTGLGGLAAILRDAPRPAPAGRLEAEATRPDTPSDAADRLAAAEAGRREAEIGRDRAEATAASRARFLANMSHELRTPLNAIMGFSDMMRAKMFGELPPKYAEYAELIHESGGHLLDLINDVLDMSKIEAQRYELSRAVFDAREPLNAALRLMRLQADDAGVKLRAVLPSEPLMIDADARAIKQIALNLLSNAVKFTPKAGSVILTAAATDGAFELIVADTGMGIASDDLKRLGQPFEQAGLSQDRARGTGLGLSLVEAFAKLHGGALTLESRLGEGTAATVRMPVLAEPPKFEAELEPTAAPSPDASVADPDDLRQTVVNIFSRRPPTP